MKRYQLYIILFIAVLIASCKKEHVSPLSGSTSPVFSFTGIIGGTAMNLQAGINNYYMYTSYTQDNNNVYNYTGNLKEQGCSSGCPPSIEFIINDYRVTAQNSSEPNINTALVVDYYKYLIPGGNPTAFSVTFVPTTNPFVKIYNWNFGDGTFANGTGSPDTIVHRYNNPGNYNTSLNTTFIGSSASSSLSNLIQMGALNPTNNLNCYTVYDTTTNSFRAYISGGTKPYNLYWSFGDSAGYIQNFTTSNTIDTISHTYHDTIINNVTLKLIDNNHDSIIVNSKVANGSAEQYRMSYHTSTPSPVANGFGFSNVTINYTDATGDVYTTNNAAQSDSSYFQVTSVSDYQVNQNSQSTKQLHIKFDCIVFDSKGNTLAIKNADAIIAVAYK